MSERLAVCPSVKCIYWGDTTRTHCAPHLHLPEYCEAICNVGQTEVGEDTPVLCVTDDDLRFYAILHERGLDYEKLREQIKLG